MRLLIVGTLSGQLGTATKIAHDRGAKVLQADSLEGAMAALRGGKGADLLLVDVKLDIGKLVSQLEAERIVVPIVACGIGTDARSAVEAIRRGAKEYLPLPPDPDLIAAVLEAVASESHQLVWKDPAMGRAVKLAEQVSKSDASVLITGESGTGKEVLARHIHRKSLRAEKPFVSVNCAAIPEALLESELFGHEKGAFTGAVARRIGKFEEANGGTLLLDEISEMDLRLQSKLLRAIQEREIDRVGGTKPVRVDIRILATSNRDMLAEVRKGTFREDLFYRLNVMNVDLPSLRNRPEDILPLAELFARRYARANGLPDRSFSATAKKMLTDHAWPGNVRELENAMHRAVLLAGGVEIGADAILLPQTASDAARKPEPAVQKVAEVATQVSKGLIGRTVAEVERELILGTLDHCLGNRTHAANILGISIRTLRNKLKEYGEDGFDVPLPGDGVRGMVSP
jgi:DNA-binding NtrC family response regulator